MRVLMFPTQNAGIMYWRFQVPCDALRRAGHTVTCFNEELYNHHIKESGSLGTWLLANAKNYDVIHSGYTPLLDHVEMLFKVRERTGLPFLIDIDDDFDAVEAYNPGFSVYRPGSTANRIVKMQAKIADGVTCTTPALMEVLSKRAAHVYELGNWINLPDWADHPQDPHRASDKSIRVMFTGGYGRYGDWNVVKEAIEGAMAKYDGTNGRPMMRLFFMGGTPDWVLQWMSSADDPAANRAFYIQSTMNVGAFQRVLSWVKPDIILSPVVKNRFNASKSHLKGLEAAMLGATFICTDWPTYGDLPPGTCLKCDNTYAQWSETLGAAIEDADLRHRLTTNAKTWVLEEGVIDRYIDKWVAAYEAVLSRSAVAGGG